ncbi:hypothetical protein J1N35_023917 [Gossypium stocksii]|uniref:DUF6821 domain-containing protein n=1 Tax=Gossypium stocksii TaxID=47602 RepID=A0A9D4A2I8_9ROSI|nr:hypothetical protein J1N35_023917 [Gossypium stocksii]
MIHLEIDADNDWVFLPDKGLPETKQGSKTNIHGGSQTSPATKPLFLADYFDPKQSANENIIRSVEAAADDDDDKGVETQECSACHEPVDSPKSNSRDVVTQIDLMDTFNFDENIRFLEENNNKEEDDMIWGEIKSKEEGNSDRFSFWKRNLKVVGGICSFGFVAVATFFILKLGNQQRKRRQRDDQKKFLQPDEQETKQDSKTKIHGGSRTNPATKPLFLVDYFDPKQSAEEKIKEPVIGSVEATADDNKGVKTQEFSACHELVNSPKYSSRDVTQIDLMGTFNFDEKIRVLEGNQEQRRREF